MENNRGNHVRLKLDLNTRTNNDIVIESNEEQSRSISSPVSSNMLHFTDNISYPITDDDINIDNSPTIGSGGMGTVFKKFHTESGFLMAIKRMRKIDETNESTRTSARQQLREIQILQKFDRCPNIVRYYGHCIANGDYYIFMEVMDTSLDKVCKHVHQLLEEQFSESFIGYVTVMVMNALSFLKEHSDIIHRDIKPSNILLDKAGMVKLCDFGISGYLKHSMAQTKGSFGSCLYLAPERILDISGYGIRADVWSLGITLFEVATGKIPYDNFENLSEFGRLTLINNPGPKQLDASNANQYTVHFRNFVNACLRRSKIDRPSYAQLREEQFYKIYDFNRMSKEEFRRLQLMVGRYVTDVYDDDIL